MKSMCIIQTVIRPLTIIEYANRISNIYFGIINILGIVKRKSELMEEVVNQISVFDRGEKNSFDLIFALEGREFRNILTLIHF